MNDYEDRWRELEKTLEDMERHVNVGWVFGTVAMAGLLFWIWVRLNE